MQIEVKIDVSQTEPKIIIVTDKITEEVNAIVKKLSEKKPQIISAYRDEKLEILEKEDMIRIYALDGKTYVVTEKGEYLLKARLYELEEKLGKDMFVRISNSDIINLKKVKSFDLSLTGTICVQLKNGMKTYVSRRYVTKIKKVWNKNIIFVSCVNYCFFSGFNDSVAGVGGRRETQLCGISSHGICRSF